MSSGFDRIDEGLDPQGLGSCESNALHYMRLLGIATAVCCAFATLLHQLENEVSRSETHWLDAFALVALCVVSTFGLSLRVGGLRSFIVLSACVFSICLCFWTRDLCETHRIFFAVLLLLDLTAAWIFMSEGKDSFERNAKPDDIGSEANEQPQSSSVASSEQEEPHQRVAADTIDDTNHQLPEGDLEQENAPFPSGGSESESVRQRPTWTRYAPAILLGSAFFIYMVLVPAVWTVIDWFTPKTSRVLTDMSTAETIRLHAVSGVVMFIFLCIGASIGSFLNVVIYRLPRGRRLLWPPSACAACKTRLAGKDNIPIYSWLKLGGRCRSCGAAVSARYPVVEAIIAGIFVLFYYRELLSGGQNLPVRQPNLYNGVVWILLYTKWDMVSIYFFHMILFTLLFAWAMINFDKFRVPRYSVALCVGIFLLLAAAFVPLNPTNSEWKSLPAWLPPSVFVSFTGLVAGAILGYAFERLSGLALAKRTAFASEETTSVAHEAEPENPLPSLVHSHIEEDTEADGNPFASPGTVAYASASASGDEVDPIDPTAQPVNTVETAEENNTKLSQDGELIELIELSEKRDLYGDCASSPSTVSNIAASLALVGTTMGPRAVLMVSCLSLCLMAVLWVMKPLVNRFAARPLPMTFSVFVATIFLLAVWDGAHALFSQML